MSGLADLFLKQAEQSIPKSLEELDQLVKASKRAIAYAAYNDPSVASDASVAGAPAWPVLSDSALHGLAGDVVRTIEPHSEADSAALLTQFLAAAGNIVSSSLHCSAGAAGLHPLILFPLIVGESSKSRKGTSWNPIKAICSAADPKWGRERISTGLSSGEGLIAEVRDDIDPPMDRRLLIVQSEFSSVLKVMSREGNNLSPVVRDAWDGQTLRTLVKRDPTTATGARITLIGHITRPELLRYLNDTEAHNGFANRLLYVCARRSKFLPEGGSPSDASLDQLQDRLHAVLQWAGSAHGLELRRDEQARALWAEVYPTLSDGLPGLLGAATARAEAQVLRISALYAALDCSSFITVRHLVAALSVWDYCLGSARYIFGDAIGDPIADRIREALFDAGEEGMTRTQIRNLLNRHASGERIARALSALAAVGLTSRQIMITEGRPAEVWIATKATKATENEP